LRITNIINPKIVEKNIVWRDPDDIVMFERYTDDGSSNHAWGNDDLIPLSDLVPPDRNDSLYVSPSTDALIIDLDIEIYDKISLDSHPIAALITDAGTTEDLLALADRDVQLVVGKHIKFGAASDEIRMQSKIVSARLDAAAKTAGPGTASRRKKIASSTDHTMSRPHSSANR